jgi:hypothetical protein
MMTAPAAPCKTAGEEIDEILSRWRARANARQLPLRRDHAHHFRRCRHCNRPVRSRASRVRGFGSRCATRARERIRQERDERDGQLRLFG